ncbi:hypothetical protein U1Q18_011560 [Sarracenia purpurea var. burkii]
METPSSVRKVARSQNLTNNFTTKKMEDSEKSVSRSRQRIVKQEDRSAIVDITNDSPIVGVAMGSLKTPSSSSKMSKKRSNIQTKTPGSGEALLRGQVKTLLQKVEEEEAEISKLCSLEQRSFLRLQGLVNSQAGLLAPTPANTPTIQSASGDENFENSPLVSATAKPVQEQFMIYQMVTDIVYGNEHVGIESEKSLTTRSLFLDFSEKTEGSVSSECSSMVTHGGRIRGEGEEEDDDEGGIEEFGDEGKEDDECVEEDAEGDEEDGGLVDALCEGMRRISVNGDKKMPKFTGRHTRFLYNSDDELEGEEECGVESEPSSSVVSPGILRFNGLPTPKGKHLRFPEELEEEEKDN